MRNIHLITKHIYITSDEDIKDVRTHNGKWQLEKGQILNKFPDYLTDLSECKLVILTTDPDLIAEGVQAINDEFLEWFVKNPSCEFIEVKKEQINNKPESSYSTITIYKYKITIPQEEPKQIKCYCGHTTYCDCGPLEEPKQETVQKFIEQHGITEQQLIDGYKQGLQLIFENASKITK
jgi:hypothetical protein